MTASLQWGKEVDCLNSAISATMGAWFILKHNGYQFFLSLLDIDCFVLIGQIKLCNSSVLIVGAGGLGCPSAQYLAAAGVGKKSINQVLKFIYKKFVYLSFELKQFQFNWGSSQFWGLYFISISERKAWIIHEFPVFNTSHILHTWIIVSCHWTIMKLSQDPLSLTGLRDLF